MVQVRLSAEPEEILRRQKQIASMLLDFSPMAEAAWPDRAAALEEVAASVRDDRRRVSIVAIVNDEAVGWVAGFQTYSHAFELHPIVVRADMQGRGIGRRLLQAFEVAAARMGALTVYLGSDDHAGRTSLGRTALFPGVLGRAQTIRNIGHHPYEFYQRCGYEIVAVLPDVNGLGQPDIWLAKPVGRAGGAGTDTLVQARPAALRYGARPGDWLHRATAWAQRSPVRFAAAMVGVVFAMKIALTPLYVILPEATITEEIASDGAVAIILTLLLGAPIETLIGQAGPMALLRLVGVRYWKLLVVLSALFFSALHFSTGPAGMLTGLLGGLVFSFCYLAWRPRSFLRAFIGTSAVHAAHNAVAFLVVLLAPG